MENEKAQLDIQCQLIPVGIQILNNNNLIV